MTERVRYCLECFEVWGAWNATLDYRHDEDTDGCNGTVVERLLVDPAETSKGWVRTGSILVIPEPPEPA